MRPAGGLVFADELGVHHAAGHAGALVLHGHELADDQDGASTKARLLGAVALGLLEDGGRLGAERQEVSDVAEDAVVTPLEGIDGRVVRSDELLHLLLGYAALKANMEDSVLGLSVN